MLLPIVMTGHELYGKALEDRASQYSSHNTLHAYMPNDDGARHASYQHMSQLTHRLLMYGICVCHALPVGLSQSDGFVQHVGCLSQPLEEISMLSAGADQAAIHARWWGLITANVTKHM